MYRSLFAGSLQLGLRRIPLPNAQVACDAVAEEEMCIRDSTRTAKLDFALRPGDAQRLSQALNTYLTFRSAADVREEQMRTAAQSLGSAVSVSYTHLDVYKRQPWPPVLRRRSPGA